MPGHHHQSPSLDLKLFPSVCSSSRSSSPHCGLPFPTLAPTPLSNSPSSPRFPSTSLPVMTFRNPFEAVWVCLSLGRQRSVHPSRSGGSFLLFFLVSTRSHNLLGESKNVSWVGQSPAPVVYVQIPLHRIGSLPIAHISFPAPTSLFSFYTVVERDKWRLWFPSFCIS